ncbi:MAG: stage III sporulation protein AC [Desulfitobacterium hafniense]|nr:stage III sporulation protein AC [Desulfitobacterium hafniense]
MNIDLILKVAGIGFIVAVLAMVLDGIGKKEQAHFVALTGMIVVLTILVQGVYDLFTLVKSVFKLY